MMMFYQRFEKTFGGNLWMKTKRNNSSLEEIFNTILKQFSKKNCLVSRKSFSLDDDKPEWKSNEQLMDTAANYLIYKWSQDHQDKRFSFRLKEIIIPTIEPDLSNILFEELLEFLSPETIKTRQS